MNRYNQQIIKFLYLTKKNLFLLVFIAVLCLLSYFAHVSISSIVTNHHFELQAKSLTELHLDIRDLPNDLNDFSYYNGLYYSPFGIFPALLLIPFILVFPFVSQHLLQFIAFPVSFILVYKIAKVVGMKKDSDRIWISIFFNFGTIFLFLSLTNISAYLAQVVSITFALASLYAHLSGRSKLWVGTFMGLAILTRPILIFTSVFFLLEILFHNNSPIKSAIRNLSLFIIPIAICILAIALFNFARFGNALDNGYDHNTSHGQDLKVARSYGFFSPHHIPGNLYLLFFKSPNPITRDSASHVLAPPFLAVDHWGAGLLFTSPLFLYIFTSLRLENFRIRAALFTILVASIPIIMFYAYGAWQYGYRHALDVYPFLLILIMHIFRENIPLRAKILIAYGVLFNLFYMYSMWGVYPFNIDWINQRLFYLAF